MQGCCCSWLHSPGWDAEHSFQRCKCSQSTHSASLAEQRRWRAAPCAAAAYANSSSQMWGGAESSILDAYTSTENRTTLEKMPWAVVSEAWPAKLTDQQLPYMGLVTFIFLMCILNEIHHSCEFTSFLSCLLVVTPAFSVCCSWFC